MRSDGSAGSGEVYPAPNSLFHSRENFFPAILDTLEETFFLFDTSFNLTWYNKSCNDLYKHVSGKSIDSSFDFNELLTPDQRLTFKEHLHKVLSGQHAHLEWRYEQSIIKWLSVSLYPFTAANGDLAGICGSLRDITETKINELVLLRNTAVLNNISDAVIYTDMQHCVLYLNKSAEEIHNISSHQINGRKLYDILDYEYIGGTKAETLELIEKKGEWEGKIIYTRSDGKKVWLSSTVTSLYDSNKHPIGLIATHKDITEEELHRQKAAQHQDNITAIINNIREGVLLIDNNYTILAFNQRTYDLEKQINTVLCTATDLIELLPEYRKRPVLDYLDLTFSGKSVEYEVLYPADTWLLINFVPVRNQQNTIIQVTITYRDITERKKAEERIRANEKKYRTLVNSLSAGVLLQNMNGQIVTANKSAAAILGLTQEELLQKGFPYPGYTIIDEKEQEILPEQLFFRKNNTLISTRNKVIGLQRENHIQWLSLNVAGVNPSRNDESSAVVISFEDITEEKKVRQEIEVLSLIAKETSNGVMIIDKSSRAAIWVNEGFTRLTGYTAEDIVNKDPGSLLLGPETDQQTVAYMVGQVDKDLPYEIDLLVYTKDGTRKIHQINGQPFRNSKGLITRYFAVSTDVTERRRLEEERLQYEIENQKEITRVILHTQETERNELGRELHDNINQILASVNLQLGFTMDNLHTGKPALKKIRDNVKEAIEEIRKLSHKMVMPRFSESDLLFELNGLIENYDYTLSIQLETSEWNEKIVSDPIKETFFRLAQEQLSNIHKHARADKIIIRLKSDLEKAEMRVEDNGIGFNPQQKRNGIGISNILNRVESYKGTSQFISAPGEGCTLVISIPLNSGM